MFGSCQLGLAMFIRKLLSQERTMTIFSRVFLLGRGPWWLLFILESCSELWGDSNVATQNLPLYLQNDS